MRKARRSYRIKLTAEQKTELAENFNAFHWGWVKQGFTLRDVCAWRRKLGGHTIRFVYRHKDDHNHSMVSTLRQTEGVS